MTSELVDFHREFLQEIELLAGVGGNYKELSFVEHFADYLIDAGEFNTFDTAYHQSKGVRVHGSAGDPQDSDGVLTLVLADWFESSEVETLTSTEVEQSFKRMLGFFKAALGEKWMDAWEETSAGYGLAELIHSRKEQLKAVRLYLLSNRRLTSRYKDRTDQVLDEIQIQHRIWDLERLKLLVESGREREEMQIRFAEEFGQPLPCLPAHVGNTDYQAYLAVVPGELLAKIYERWGTRLLEQNVRCFLQARGKVNKGIKKTIQTEPSMFFAYNNGITATAEEIETEETASGLQIRRLRNLQIVNGGQTTASIFTTGRGKIAADLSGIFVQMKLSVVSSEQAREIVPNISRFANSQNAVNAADFFSNHPYHVRLEEASRRIMTPTIGENIHPTRWFYERARGQYQDARSRTKIGSERKAWDKQYPRRQVFTKTDLAKFINVWRQIPHVVSQGSQKNFANFANYVGEQWDKDENNFNDQYFKATAAKAIVFRRMERLVSEQSWYEGGYRANIVAYAISRLALAIQEEKQHLDFNAIWSRQKLTVAMEKMLVEVAKKMHELLLTPPEGIRNISEYAKKTICWDLAQQRPITLSGAFRRELISTSAARSRAKEAREIRKDLDGFEAVTHVLGLRDADSNYWRKVWRFGFKNKLMSDKDKSIIEKTMLVPKKVPSELQAKYLVQLLARFKEEGFTE